MNIRKQFYRFLLSMTHLRGKDPSVILTKAMQDDPELRRHWNSEEKLTQALRGETQKEVPIPSDLERKILARTGTKQAKVIPFWQTASFGRQMTAVAAILVLGTIILVLRNEQPVNMDTQPETPFVEPAMEQPGALITLESPIENHPLVQLSAIIESPLREEPQRLISDAENALRFLSKSFLPSEEWREEMGRRIMGVKTVSNLGEDT